MVDMVRLRHFNADYPENQNYRKEDKRNTLATVYAEGNQWEIMTCDSAITKLMDNMLDFFINKFLYNFMKEQSTTNDNKDVCKIILKFCKEISQDLHFDTEKLRDFLHKMEHRIINTNDTNNKNKKKIFKIIQDVLCFETDSINDMNEKLQTQQNTETILCKYKQEDKKEYTKLQLAKKETLDEYKRWKEYVSDGCENANPDLANAIFQKKWKSMKNKFKEEHSIDINQIEL